LLDEAYVEYMEPAGRAPSLQWLEEFPNLILTRTFSKAYGLAGLRVGYAAVPADVADLLNRVRQPFNVNSLALWPPPPLPSTTRVPGRTKRSTMPA
jgi:histidinol-phosphate aminotransferase